MVSYMYFPEAGNLNGSDVDMCSDVAGSSSSGSGDLFEPSDRSNETTILLFTPLLALLAAILDMSMTTTLILPSGRVTSSCIRSICLLSMVIHFVSSRQTRQMKSQSNESKLNVAY